MRIAVIGTRGEVPALDGVDRALGEICPRLARRGHEIDVFSDRNGRAITPVEGARMIRLPSVPTGFGPASHALVSSLLTAFRGYDVVNFVAADATGLFTMASKLGLHRTVVSVHGLGRGEPAARFPRLGPETAAARFADVITVVSRRLERFFRDVHGRETIFIPNGIDPATSPPSAEAVVGLGLAPRGYLLVSDRLVPESGIHHVVAALRSLPAGARLAIAETGPGDDAYRAALGGAADPDRVRFLGTVAPPLLDALVAHAHLYVLPSARDEPAPILLQALAHGQAAVVSDLPEHLEMVGADGFSFTSGDVGDLRRVLAWLLDDREVVARMRLRAAATATHRYSWDRIADAYEQVYSSIA